MREMAKTMVTNEHIIQRKLIG